jgi:hypothetical protein
VCCENFAKSYWQRNVWDNNKQKGEETSAENIYWKTSHYVRPIEIYNWRGHCILTTAVVHLMTSVGALILLVKESWGRGANSS